MSRNALIVDSYSQGTEDYADALEDLPSYQTERDGGKVILIFDSEEAKKEAAQIFDSLGIPAADEEQ